MPGPERDPPDNLIDDFKSVFDTTPQGEDGIGPTLGQDVGKPNPGAAKPAEASDAAPQRTAPATR